MAQSPDNFWRSTPETKALESKQNKGHLASRYYMYILYLCIYLYIYVYIYIFCIYIYIICIIIYIYTNCGWLKHLDDSWFLIPKGVTQNWVKSPNIGNDFIPLENPNPIHAWYIWIWLTISQMVGRYSLLYIMPQAHKLFIFIFREAKMNLHNFHRKTPVFTGRK